ncbi:zinc-ribbon domain-containing protein, partial [Acetobacter fabarum]|uniref:zinc-ribbon domain-containing protein n=1 Tax=Acetobacter fabarum TaxID=483199 RepID=UPI0039E95148
MKIVCPSCGAAYQVPEALLAKRHTLKCSACGVKWRLTPPDAPEDGPAGTIAPAAAPDAPPAVIAAPVENTPAEPQAPSLPAQNDPGTPEHTPEPTYNKVEPVVASFAAPPAEAKSAQVEPQEPVTPAPAPAPLEVEAAGEGDNGASEPPIVPAPSAPQGDVPLAPAPVQAEI